MKPTNTAIDRVLDLIRRGEENRVEEIMGIISANPEVVNQTGRGNITPLIAAANKLDSRVFKLLIELKADINLKSAGYDAEDYFRVAEKEAQGKPEKDKDIEAIKEVFKEKGFIAPEEKKSEKNVSEDRTGKPETKNIKEGIRYKFKADDSPEIQPLNSPVGTFEAFSLLEDQKTNVQGSSK